MLLWWVLENNLISYLVLRSQVLVWPPLPLPLSARGGLGGRGGGWTFYQIFKKGDLAESQSLEGGFWERGDDLFQGAGGGVRSFYINNKLKSKIFKVCVCYSFVSLFFMPKREHLWNKEECFLFHLESPFRSWDNQILTFQILKCHDVIKFPSMKHETHFTE